MITILKKDETDGINDTDGDDESDEDLPSILVLIGSRIGVMRRGLVSHHLLHLSHLTWVRGKYNEQPVDIYIQRWVGWRCRNTQYLYRSSPPS